MNRLVLLGLCAVALLGSGWAGPVADLAAEPVAAPRPAAAPALGPMTGLAGIWRGTLGGAVVEEIWLPPHQGNMTGALRWYGADGSVRMLEVLTLTAEDDGARFRIRHFDAAMTPWPSEADGPMEAVAVSTEGGRLVFRSEARARATTGMVYDLSEPGRLTVTLTFEGGRDPVVIPFERVK